MNKKYFLKTAKERQQIIYKGISIRLSGDFSAVTQQVRSEGYDMFKMMKNNLKNLMTKSLGGTLNYKNLSAIGISTGEAQDSITTDVTALMIDKDKFIQCLDENSDAVKQLLVGTDANQGVFWKANDIAFKTLMQTGYIASTEKTLNKEITKIGKKITSLTTALAHYREQLQAKFSTMERTISGLQTSYSGLLSM